MFGFSSAFAKTAFDPLSISVGARALGMGRAGVAVAEEGDAIFNNPAGLGQIDSFKFTSMGGSLLEDATYTVLGGIYPLGGQSAAGIGFTGAFVSGIEIRDVSSTFSRKANFGSSVVLASFGKKVSEKTSLGINLKYFFSDGTEIDNGDGQGWNLDAGILQSDLGWFNLGLVGQNIISSGKMNYKNGESENLPFTVKVGTKMYIAGSRYQSAIFSPVELIAAADAEQSLDQSRPPALHLGVEFSPSPFLTLRAGSDQGNAALGLSLKFAGLGFHYAYNVFAQYLSITFDERGWPPEENPDVYLGQK